ncbi:hypothetical protein LSH36_52g08013 [Paralvinella palmiformis]|uniref:COMM domain-containing protein 3 n=1 Tax=Paralvinella palmiformis TaxID=53620 RepID=A0AAD9K5H4_9ANNE|nr:hypothetical protein LSH36_52g08013 [Paralvinella palmiformis]
MELSADFVQGLQLLGNNAVVDDVSFDLLLQLSLDSILSPDSLEGSPPSAKLNNAQLKLGVASFITFLLEATKLDRDGTSLRHFLEELHFSEERLDKIIHVFEENKTNIRHVLASISSTYPHITDVRWRVEYYIKNNQLHKIGQPQYQIQLQTQKSGDGDVFQFSCSQEQLQDMVGKLKEACKSLERAHQVKPS